MPHQHLPQTKYASIILGLVALCSHADIWTWTGASDNDWTTPANWLKGAVIDGIPDGTNAVASFAPTSGNIYPTINAFSNITVSGLSIAGTRRTYIQGPFTLEAGDGIADIDFNITGGNDAWIQGGEVFFNSDLHVHLAGSRTLNFNSELRTLEGHTLYLNDDDPGGALAIDKFAVDGDFFAQVYITNATLKAVDNTLNKSGATTISLANGAVVGDADRFMSIGANVAFVLADGTNTIGHLRDDPVTLSASLSGRCVELKHTRNGGAAGAVTAINSSGNTYQASVTRFHNASGSSYSTFLLNASGCLGASREVRIDGDCTVAVNDADVFPDDAAVYVVTTSVYAPNTITFPAEGAFIEDTIAAFYVDGVKIAAASYGATGSGAQYTNDGIFSGSNGVLKAAAAKGTLFWIR